MNYVEKFFFFKGSEGIFFLNRLLYFKANKNDK